VADERRLRREVDRSSLSVQLDEERQRTAALDAEVAKLKSDLASSQALLAATTADLDSTRTALESTTASLGQALAESAELRKSLGAAEACLASINAALGVSGAPGGECPTSGLEMIFIDPGTLMNQTGLARNPNAGRAILVAPPGPAARPK
jgi:hypothetical protein